MQKKTSMPVFRSRNIPQTGRITLPEAGSLIFRGIKRQCIDTVKSVFSLPAIMGAVGIGTALTMLPLFGIPMSVGAGVLAIGFGTFSALRAGKHAISFAKSNRNGDYKKARYNLEKIGEDSIDLAFSIPFVPKAAMKVNQFRKYGKIGYNMPAGNKTIFSLFDDEKQSMELDRKLNFSQAADKEIKSTDGLSKAEASRIKQELPDFNIPDEMIPEVILDKWAAKNGVRTKPLWSYKTMSSGTAGYASETDCSIVLNDFKKDIKKAGRYELKDRTFSKGNYKYTYYDKQNHCEVVEFVPKKIVEDSEKLAEQYRAATPQLRRILTTFHEREHIDQFARMIMAKGNNVLNQVPDAAALKRYNEMIQDIARQGISVKKSKEIADIIATVNTPGNGTYAEYLKRPIEIGARKAEAEALKDPLYKYLDNIYKFVNKNTSKPDNGKAIMLNTLRADSIAS